MLEVLFNVLITFVIIDRISKKFIEVVLKDKLYSFEISFHLDFKDIE